MNLSTKPYKGTRDLYPEDMRLQKFIFNNWRQTLESFGYEEYDAPLLESLEIYTAKTGEEIVNQQTYSFTDRGGRQVVIRPEMTPSVSRMVAAKRQELAYPLRWYSIPNFMRYERPQRGRLREFWQLNADLFGVDSQDAEFEMILISDSLLKKFGASRSMFKICINDRRLMEFITNDYLGLNEDQSQKLFKLIDRMKKMEKAEFSKEIQDILTSSQKQTDIDQKIYQILEVNGIEDLPEQVKSSQPAKDLLSLLELSLDSGLSNVEFDITVMRGFDYYTGFVFEIFDTNPENNRAMAGGGRYDGLVGLFGAAPVPTIGFGFGEVPLINFLESNNLNPSLKSETEVYAVLVGDVFTQSQKVLARLREEGVTVAVDASNKKPGDKIKNALKKNIRFALFIGEKELNDEQFNLKDLVNQQEQTLSLERVVSSVLDQRLKNV